MNKIPSIMTILCVSGTIGLSSMLSSVPTHAFEAPKPEKTITVPQLKPLLTDKILQQLDLNSEQQVFFIEVREQSEISKKVIVEQLNTLRTAIRAEFQLDDPNLRYLDGLAKETRAIIFEAMDNTRALRLDFYDTLSAEQRALVREQLEKRFFRLQRAWKIFNKLSEMVQSAD